MATMDWYGPGLLHILSGGFFYARKSHWTPPDQENHTWPQQ